MYYTDPRIAALARTTHATTPGDPRSWRELGDEEQRAWITAARD
ncbi:hypothetical protein [Embleya sp. AB8]